MVVKEAVAVAVAVAVAAVEEKEAVQSEFFMGI